MANILTPVIIELLDDLDSVLSSGGRFICSGIIQASKDSVIEKMITMGLDPIEVCNQDEWVAIVAKRG